MPGAKVTHPNTTNNLNLNSNSNHSNPSDPTNNNNNNNSNNAHPRLQTAKPTSVAFANPFYDNIRQNLELSSGITERIPLIMPPHIAARATELPFQWLKDIVRKASARSLDGVIGGEALEDLAMQFYRIELGEQRRLTGVMEHHSHESTTQPGQMEITPTEFPYSITAGVEKGAKNR